mgnify:CR=1 FL=1
MSMNPPDTAPPDDEYLSADQVMHLRAILRESGQTILDQSRETVTSLTEVKGSDGDPVDQAANESDRGFELRMADRSRNMLKKIRKALERVDEGEYGSCETCGEEVGYKRLLARPVATQCIDCKTSAEQKEHRRWDF